MSKAQKDASLAQLQKDWKRVVGKNLLRHEVVEFWPDLLKAWDRKYKGSIVGVDSMDDIADLCFSLNLYLPLHTWKQLTTDQKNLLADLIDMATAELYAAEKLEPIERWWRDV